MPPVNTSVRYSGSEESLQKASAWLRSCLSNHGACVSRDEQTLPDRVLDIGSDHQCPILLLETACKVGRYVCLSYCWGSPIFICTKTANIDSFRRGDLRLQYMPQTLQDAIEVSRLLGFRYLWVDALCIIQDDTADWESQAGQMAAIYSKSHLTICALASSDAKQGCYTRWTSIRQGSLNVRIIAHLPNSATNDTTKCPLVARA